ncbi:hypothetical protein OIDMADRAFT_22102 [Oidiodendron maius Zn]|uniref:Uncharacterized protein n=1 Tax=Oidiodendron maius (strain Zn) TaxID=913774 RepID=A0A0C3HYA9_OIDMZ|nr:hypothetical protein OIDMADRAFT_22102 [Oidiodendron maius Zn]
MKALKISAVLTGMAVAATGLPGLHRFSSDHTAHHLNGTHINANVTKSVAARAVVDLPDVSLTATAGSYGHPDGPLNMVSLAKSASTSIGNVNLVESDDGFIWIATDAGTATKITPSAPGSVNDISGSMQVSSGITAESTQGSVDIVNSNLISRVVSLDSTQGVVNKVAESTQVADSNPVYDDASPDSTQRFVNKVPDSTQGVESTQVADSTQFASSTQFYDSTQAVDSTQVAHSTQVVESTQGSNGAARVPASYNSAVSSDSKLHPFSTNVNSVTLRPIIPVPTSIPFGVFPRGVYGIYGSLGEGYITSTATSKSVVLSASGTSFVIGMKDVSHGPVIPGTESTQTRMKYATGVIFSDLPSTRSNSTLDIITTETTVIATSTITGSSTSTITQLIALNPAYQTSSIDSHPCPGITTVTVTVVATNTVASYLPTTVKYKNVTVSTRTSGISPFTLRTVTSYAASINPCIPTPPPGFVGLQLPSDSGATCTASSISASTIGDGGQTSTSSLPFSTGAVGATDINVAFLVGFVALAVFV